MGRLSWGSMIAVVKKDGKALQKLENGQGHCTVASQMYCRPRKISRSTARSHRKCSTEAGKKAGALHCCAGSAVQKPENRPGHCTVAPGVQYRSRKATKRNARKTGRSSCNHHFMFMEYFTFLISTIDKRMVDNTCKRRGDSRLELKTRTKYSN